MNFANNDNKAIETYAKSTNSLGDVELVSGNVVKDVALVENDSFNNGTVLLDNKINSDINVSEEQESTEVSNNSSTTNKSNYFSEVKLNRNMMYDEVLETYQKMIDSNTISSEQKSIAVREIEKITKQKSSISIAEELIKLKGFENVVILINDENVNVIVRIAVLSKEQVVQIQNIVTKELGVEVSNISISTK